MQGDWKWESEFTWAVPRIWFLWVLWNFLLIGLLRTGWILFGLRLWNRKNKMASTSMKKMQLAAGVITGIIGWLPGLSTWCSFRSFCPDLQGWMLLFLSHPLAFRELGSQGERAGLECSYQHISYLCAASLFKWKSIHPREPLPLVLKFKSRSTFDRKLYNPDTDLQPESLWERGLQLTFMHGPQDWGYGAWSEPRPSPIPSHFPNSATPPFLFLRQLYIIEKQKFTFCTKF